jgi:glycosyltransferase involved in cell wall biosynthesis
MYEFLINKRFVKYAFAKYKLEHIDICITTYNRFPYLQKCIWSIVASTTVPYKIHVVDDVSTDDTTVFLRKMLKDGLIHSVIFNEKKIGTANSFNKLINSTKSNLFVFSNDDMWFHRWWDLISIEIFNLFDNCGLVSMFNYTAMKIGSNATFVNKHVMHVKATGLGASMMYRNLWDVTGGFDCNTLMGFFASAFCNKIRIVDIVRNQLYAIAPHFVTHMDLPSCKLNERDYSNKIGYIDFRKKHKLNK